MANESGRSRRVKYSSTSPGDEFSTSENPTVPVVCARSGISHVAHVRRGRRRWTTVRQSIRTTASHAANMRKSFILVLCVYWSAQRSVLIVWLKLLSAHAITRRFRWMVSVIAATGNYFIHTNAYFEFLMNNKLK